MKLENVAMRSIATLTSLDALQPVLIPYYDAHAMCWNVFFNLIPPISSGWFLFPFPISGLAFLFPSHFQWLFPFPAAHISVLIR